MKHLPPRAPSSNVRPSSGSFHNRGRLFSTLNRQLSSDGTHTVQNASREQSLPTPTAPDKTYVPSPQRHRHVQSAKARLEISNTIQLVLQDCENHHASDDSSTVSIPGSDLAVYDVNQNLTIDHKPARRSSQSLATKDSEQFIHHNISFDKSANRPSSAKYPSWTSVPISPAVEEEKEEKVAEDLKPSVYGYRLKRQVYGSNPDIFTSGLLALQPVIMFKLDETDNKPSNRDPAEGNSSAPSCSRYEEVLYLEQFDINIINTILTTFSNLEILAEYFLFF